MQVLKLYHLGIIMFNYTKQIISIVHLIVIHLFFSREFRGKVLSVGWIRERENRKEERDFDFFLFLP